MKYMILDLETENHTEYKRLGNPFTGNNWIVARGYKIQGDTQCTAEYFPTKEDVTELNIPDDVSILVGHNIKYDLLYEWHTDSMKTFFKRGGKIWDTQYAEYLLEAMKQDSHMNSMDGIIEKYGGRLKIDEVKILWNNGVLTSEIDKNLLIDYLIGTEEEGRNSGDIGNTEIIFLGQIKRAIELNMVTMIQSRMDGLLATTEMEYNGLKIDIAEAKRRMTELQNELQILNTQLEEYIPELPDGLTFNWNSNIHKSCLIFGGTVKYEKSAPYIDNNTGELARFKAKEKQPLFNGEPTPIKECSQSPDGNDLWIRDSDQCIQDTYVSGKKKGTGKFKNVDVLGEIKTKKQKFFFTFDGYTKPDNRWLAKTLDGADKPIYFTNADVIDDLRHRDIAFLNIMARRQDLDKDLGTYYVKTITKKDSIEYKGMLTCVQTDDHIVHHSLNHTSTVTARLSSSNPNLQNIPRAGTSDVKKMFISRFNDGCMIEADYSQLEVVVQGMLSNDRQLVEDLNNKIDFHCKRVALQYDIPYEEALYRCKDETYEDHKLWNARRTAAKEFSFQRAYGAGASSIAISTGLDIDVIKELITIEEDTYSGLVDFYTKIEEEIKQSAKPFNDPNDGYKTYRRGYWQAPTGTRYTFRSYNSPDYMQDRGITESFKPTEIKNYPIQGTGGEVMQVILGKLWRHFTSNSNYGGKALLCNTVHDCVWIDADNDVLEIVCKDIKHIMESVPEVFKELHNIDVNVPFPVEVEVGSNMADLSVVHI